MSWGIQYWIIIKITKKFLYYLFWKCRKQTRGTRFKNIHIYIYSTWSNQVSMLSAELFMVFLVCLFVCLICVTQRGPKWYLAHEMETSHVRHLEFCYTGLSYVWYESIIELEDYRRWHWIAPLPITHAVCCTCNLA